MIKEWDRVGLLLLCAEEHKLGEKVSIVSNWEVKRVGSRAKVILDGRALCTQASEDMVTG